MGALTKRVIVERWWEEALRRGRQLPFHTPSGEPYTMVRVSHPSQMWREAVGIDALYMSFKHWLRRHFPMFEEDFSKISFLMLFYRTSGARRTYLLVGGRRVPAARFESLDQHKLLHNLKAKEDGK